MDYLKIREYEYQFKDTIYNITYHVFLCKKGYNRLRNVCGQEYIPEKGVAAFASRQGNIDHKIYSKYRTFNIVYLDDILFDSQSYSYEEAIAVIAHEAWHLIEIILPEYGIKLSWDGEINEHIAYYMSFLVKNISEIYKESLSHLKIKYAISKM